MRSQPLSPTHRDRYRNLVAVITGCAAATSVAAVGAVSGAAAHATQQERAARAAQSALARAAYEEAVREQAAAETPSAPVVVKQRPTRTVVTKEVVAGAARPGTARVGGGSAHVSAGSSHRTTIRSAARPSPAAPAKAKAPAAPPPPPPVVTAGS